jgi:pyruvate,orthophosphate dikinase
MVMPEIVEMQVRAIFEDAAYMTRKGIAVHPEVMIPMTGM